MILLSRLSFGIPAPAVAEAIAGKTIAKEIYVKGKLVNIAVKG